MNFQKIKEELIDTNPSCFLMTVLENEQEEDNTIVFSQVLEEQFEQSIRYLASEETISLDDLSSWKERGFLVVAQTIDGDYIAGTSEQTFVIPVSLYKTDIETYHLPLPDFFIAYTNHTIVSSILPKNP